MNCRCTDSVSIDYVLRNVHRFPPDLSNSNTYGIINLLLAAIVSSKRLQ